MFYFGKKSYRRHDEGCLSSKKNSKQEFFFFFGENKDVGEYVYEE